MSLRLFRLYTVHTHRYLYLLKLTCNIDSITVAFFLVVFFAHFYIFSSLFKVFLILFFLSFYFLCFPSSKMSVYLFLSVSVSLCLPLAKISHNQFNPQSTCTFFPFQSLSSLSDLFNIIPSVCFWYARYVFCLF